MVARIVTAAVVVAIVATSAGGRTPSRRFTTVIVPIGTGRGGMVGTIVAGTGSAATTAAFFAFGGVVTIVIVSAVSLVVAISAVRGTTLVTAAFLFVDVFSFTVLLLLCGITVFFAVFHLTRLFAFELFPNDFFLAQNFTEAAFFVGHCVQCQLLAVEPKLNALRIESINILLCYCVLPSICCAVGCLERTPWLSGRFKVGVSDSDFRFRWDRGPWVGRGLGTTARLNCLLSMLSTSLSLEDIFYKK